ncbi:MAG: GvpL/GvpF family gas vesicle protein [Bacteroidota bacterium]
MKSKLYLYGVVHSNESKSLGPLGLSTDGSPNEILLHSHMGIGVAYMEKEVDDNEEMPASRKNLVNHQRVIELMMNEFTVLPFAFGTIIEDIPALEKLIDERREDFEKTLTKIVGKVELNLKILWEKMDVIFESLIQENEEINQKRQYLIDHNINDQDEKIELGKMVEDALDKKKEMMLNRVLDELKPHTIDHKVQKTISDAMFANLAFFIERENEKAFDAKVNELSDKMGENLVFKYVGPMAPVNFI